MDRLLVCLSFVSYSTVHSNSMVSNTIAARTCSGGRVCVSNGNLIWEGSLDNVFEVMAE